MTYLEKFRQESIKPELWLALGKGNDMRVCYYLPCSMCPHKVTRPDVSSYDDCCKGLCEDLNKEIVAQTSEKALRNDSFAKSEKVSTKIIPIDSERFLRGKR